MGFNCQKVHQAFGLVLTLGRLKLDVWVDRVQRRDNELVVACLIVMVLGCGAYGFTLGAWKSPLMGLYAAIKLPLLVLLVAATNGLLNGIMAQLLNSGLTLRQTMTLLLSSYALFGLVALSMIPVSLYLMLSVPPAGDPAQATGHACLLVLHTVFIAVAGVLSHGRMFRLMLALARNRLAAVQTFFAWMAGNLLLGSQMAYVLRPFFGNPGSADEFLRADALSGNFYIGLASRINQLFGGNGGWVVLVLLPLIAFMALTARPATQTSS